MSLYNIRCMKFFLTRLDCVAVDIISIYGWDITTSGLEKQTSTILEFYFWFRSRPFSRNLHFILHQSAEFPPNRSRHCGNNNVISLYQHGGRGRWILFPVSHLLISLPSEGQSLWENQISSTYLNWWLRFNYLRLWKTNDRHIGSLLSVLIATTSRNVHVILHHPTEFRPNRSTHAEI